MSACLFLFYIYLLVLFVCSAVFYTRQTTHFPHMHTVGVRRGTNALRLKTNLPFKFFTIQTADEYF